MVHAHLHYTWYFSPQWCLQIYSPTANYSRMLREVPAYYLQYVTWSIHTRELAAEWPWSSLGCDMHWIWWQVLVEARGKGSLELLHGNAELVRCLFMRRWGHPCQDVRMYYILTSKFQVYTCISFCNRSNMFVQVVSELLQMSTLSVKEIC